MHIDLHSDPWRVDKDESEYDAFTRQFVAALPPDVQWVLVSGYPALLFGRTRNTEDIDIIVRRLDRDRFHQFWSRLVDAFTCL